MKWAVAVVVVATKVVGLVLTVPVVAAGTSNAISAKLPAANARATRVMVRTSTQIGGRAARKGHHEPCRQSGANCSFGHF